MSSSSKERIVVTGICAVLVLMVCFVFGRALFFGFANFDDNRYITENAFVLNGLTLEGIRHFLTHVHCANWHPITSFSYMLDAQLYGMNPVGYHFGNIALHAAVAVSLFLTLRSLTGSLWRSAIVAALFAVHPLRVESVVWIAERKDELSGLFFMLTLWAYARYVRGRFSVRNYLAVVFLFTLGLMCKSMLVTLPALLLLLDYWPLRRFGFVKTGRLIFEKIPLFILSALFSVLMMHTQESALAKLEVPLLYRAANALVAYIVYLKQLVWPYPLVLLYPHPGSSLPLWKACVALCILLIVLAIAWVLRKNRPYLLTGWLWYLGMFVPVIGLVQIGVQAHADRYTYLPHIGLFIMLVWMAADVPLLRRKRVWAGTLAAVVLVFLMLAARAQVDVWRSNVSLWSHTVEYTENNATAYVSLGSAFYSENELSAAEACCLKAIEIDPHHEQGMYNLGFVRARQGRYAEAADTFRRTLEINPDSFETHKAFGAILIMQGQLDEGIRHSRLALQLKPGDAEVLQNLKAAEALLNGKAGQ